MAGESAGGRYSGSETELSSKRALAPKDCMQHMSSEQTEELQAERDLRGKVSTLMTESAPRCYITAHESQL